MTDLDGELEALRRETRQKLDQEADLEKRLAALESPAGHDIPPAPAVSQPSARAREGSSREKTADVEPDGDAGEDDARRLATEAKVKALNLATRALLEGPEAMVKASKLARTAGGLSLLQKLSLGVVSLIALVVLWRLVFQPLLILAIVIGICTILVLGAMKFFGKSDGDDSDDEKSAD